MATAGPRLAMRIRLTLVAENYMREMMKDKDFIGKIFPGYSEVSPPDLASAIIAQFGKKWKEKKNAGN
jgi:hypothetical protein